jgi:hypothetical protein
MRHPNQFSPLKSFGYARADLPDFVILTYTKLAKLIFKVGSIIFVLLGVSNHPQEIWLISYHGALAVFVKF